MRRAKITLLASIALLVAAPEGTARTNRKSHFQSAKTVAKNDPQVVPGAVLKPRSFKIRVPFPCGVPVRVNASYGFHAHKRVQGNATNDYYAIDFTRLAPKNGFDRSVVAVAAGTVRQAGWMRGGWAPYGQVVYIEHAFRDSEGHRYQSLYAHLNRVKVSQGQRVRAGQPVGTLGGSSMGSRGRLGFHLHFAMYQDAKRAILGGGRAVLPEPMGHFRNLRAGTQFVACGRPDPIRVASLPGAPIWEGSGGLDRPQLQLWPTDDRGLLAVGGLLEPLE